MSVYADDAKTMALLSELVIVRTVFESLEPVHFGNTLEKLKTISPIERVIIKNIMIVMKIVLTTRATSATPGRSFSVARRVKTSLRSSMTQKRLNALAILHSHVDIVPTQRRHRYVPNETPNGVSMERHQDVSVVRLHDVLLEHRNDVSKGRNNDVPPVRLHDVSKKSQMKYPTTSQWYITKTNQWYVSTTSH